MTEAVAPAAILREGDTEIELKGPPYLEALAELHRRLRPRTYFEIGTWLGDSLRLAGCTSLAVDPHFQLEEGVIGSKPACTLHQMSSDDFFARHDPKALLGGPIELAFIDGYHRFEFALRDFIGTEQAAEPAGVVVLDDCCPRDFFMTRPAIEPEVPHETRYPGYWTGDVWKLVPVLREYRPDIDLVVLDTLPTGLAICRRLDPTNGTLAARYDEIVDQWGSITLESYGMSRLLNDLKVVPAGEWLAGLHPIHPEDPGPVPSLSPSGLTPRERRALAEELMTVRAELEVMRSSRSWRWTRPLRAMTQLMRSGRDG